MKGQPFQVIADGYVLTRADPGCWRILSPSGASYTVDPEAGTCTCPDVAARGHRRACKHLKAIWALLKLVPDLNEEV